MLNINDVNDGLINVSSRRTYTVFLIAASDLTLSSDVESLLNMLFVMFFMEHWPMGRVSSHE